MQPRLAYKAENTLAGDGSELSVELNFKKLDDFRPDNVAAQVAPLRDLMEVRRQLKALLSKTEGNDRLEELLDGHPRERGDAQQAEGRAGCRAARARARRVTSHGAEEEGDARLGTDRAGRPEHPR